MIENKQVMADNILRFMDAKGIKATDICKALDIKHNTFSDWVNAKTYPRIDKIEKMASFFGVSKADLVEKYHEEEIAKRDELILLREYRNADVETKEMVKRILLYSRKITGELHDD
jgi:transcriptional regulator with XRE-family HTH domain